MASSPFADRIRDEALRPIANLLRNYERESLDTERDAGLIIRTVLALGSWEQTKWLFARYGWDRVRQVFWDDANGLATLPESASALWRVMFGLPEPVARKDAGWGCRRRTPPERAASDQAGRCEGPFPGDRPGVPGGAERVVPRPRGP